MRVYVTSAGKTALMVANVLERPLEEFRFDLAVMLADNAFLSDLYEKYNGFNLMIVPISNPYFGLMDYCPTVRRLVKQILLFGANPELIILNSSGGTEKMTNIIKDAGEILSVRYPVERVFGVYDKDTKEVIFTKKPTINAAEEFAEISEEAQTILNLKEHMNGSSDLDFD